MSERVMGRCDLKQYEHCGDHEQIKERGQKLPPFRCQNWVPVSEQQTDCQAQPVGEASEDRRRLMPQVLDRYAEDLERNRVPIDSAFLPFTLRYAASMLREMQEVTELLDSSGQSIGNEHRKYQLLERVRNLITTKAYAWRRYDEVSKGVDVTRAVAEFRNILEDCATAPSRGYESAIDRVHNYAAHGLKSLGADLL